MSEETQVSANGEMMFDFGGDRPAFELMPIGVYDAEVFDAQFVEHSKNSGQPMVTWTFRPTDDKFSQRRLILHTSLTPQAIFRTKQAIERITGQQLKIALSVSQLRSALAELVRKQCKIRVEHEEYEGQTRDKVKEVVPSNATVSAGAVRSGLFG